MRITAAEWCGTEKRADCIVKEHNGCAASANLVPRVLFYTGRREPRCDFFETFAFCTHQLRSSLCAPASTEHSKPQVGEVTRLGGVTHLSI